MKLVPKCARGHPWTGGQVKCLECEVQDLREDRNLWRVAAIALALLLAAAALLGK